MSDKRYLYAGVVVVVLIALILAVFVYQSRVLLSPSTAVSGEESTVMVKLSPEMFSEKGLSSMVVAISPSAKTNVIFDSSELSEDQINMISKQLKESGFSSVTNLPGSLSAEISTEHGGKVLISNGEISFVSNYMDYIVEFKGEPAASREKALRNELEQLKQERDAALKAGRTAIATNLEKNIATRIGEGAVEVSNYKNELEREHASALSDIKNKLESSRTSLVGSVIAKITGNQVEEPQATISEEYYNAFNGVLVKDASASDIVAVRKSPYVKNVYPDKKVKVSLSDSVPLINADDVWQLEDSFGENITGKGVKIAIIDTGVDYTHPDLGGCFGNNNASSSCKVIGGYDFVNDDSDPMDDMGHGTHVAATAAGKFNSAEEGAGAKEIVGLKDVSGGEVVMDGAVPLSPAAAVPFYRLLCPSDHFYTTSSSERQNAIVNLGCSDEDIMGYLYLTQKSGTVPLYRLYNSGLTNHAYTIDADQKDLLQTPAFGYTYEGIAGYVYPTQTQGTMPIYRLWCASAGDNLYTMDKNEYDSVVRSGQCTEETDPNLRIEGYAYPLVSCFDTDGGINRDQKGTATKYNRGQIQESKTDQCSLGLEEYYCSGSNIMQTGVACPYGTECTDGACVPITCDDPDKNEANNGIFRKTNVCLSSASCEADSCASGTSVNEKSCSGIDIVSTVYTCPGGVACTNGACLQAFCGDNTCGSGETCSNCPSDCGVCPDITPPGVFIANPVEGDVYSTGNYRVEIDLDERDARCEFSVDDGVTKEKMHCTNFECDAYMENVSGGDYTLRAYCTDLAGNLNDSESVSFTMKSLRLDGVAPDAKILAYKVLDSGGSGYLSDVIAGIDMAVDPNGDGNFSDRADIISMSLGGSGDPDDPVSTAVDNAVDAGVVAVIAAGNGGPGEQTIGSPGTAKKAITVGAVYKKNYTGDYFGDTDPRADQITSFSSRGPVIWDGGALNKPDVVAPGAFICAARYDSIYPEGADKYYKPCFDEKHVQFAGTSMATPHVAGVIALMKQKYPNLTPEELKSLVKMTSIDLGYDINTQGAGRVDALAAVSSDILISGDLEFGRMAEGQTTAEKIITIKNIGESELSVTLNAEKAVNLEGVVLENAFSFSESSFTLAPGGEKEITANLTFPIDSEGAFSGKVRINDGEKDYFLDYSFSRYSTLILTIEGDHFANFFAHDDSMDKIYSAWQGWDFVGNTINLTVLSGNYTVYATNDFVSSDYPYLYPETDEYILSDMVNVPVGGVAEKRFNLDDAKAFNMKTRSLSGEQLALNYWGKSIVTYRNDMGICYNYSGTSEDECRNNSLGVLCGWSDGWCYDRNLQITTLIFGGDSVGDKIVYVSNKPNNSLDNNLIFKYDGGILDVISSSEDYLVAKILHNINDETPMEFEAGEESYAKYTFSQNLPATGPQFYAGSAWLFVPGITLDVNLIRPLVAPLEKVFYVFADDENVSEDFEFSRDIFLNYIDTGSYETQWPYNYHQQESTGEIVPFAGDERKFSFGGDYLPGSISAGGLITLKDNALLGGVNTKIDATVNALVSDLESPRYSIYEDGASVSSGNLVSNDHWYPAALSYPISENKNYIVNVTIPSYYPIFNMTTVTAEFSTSGDDWDPPWLSGLEVSPKFSEGGSLVVSVNASDSVVVSGIQIYSRSDGGEWTPVGLTKETTENNMSASGSIAASGEKIDLKIMLTDSSGNNQSYVIEPVSLKQRDLSIEFNKDKEILSPGSKVNFYGKINDSEGGVGSLLVRVNYNGNEIARTYTSSPRYKWTNSNYVEGREYNFDFSVPLDYSEDDNLSLIFGGTGVYPVKEYVISGFASIFDTDAAVTNLEVSKPLWAGENSVNVTLANSGLNDLDGNLDIYTVQVQPDYSSGTVVYHESGERKLIASTPISISSKETLNVSLSGDIAYTYFESKDNFVKVIADFDVVDENPYNNELSVVRAIASDYDAEIRFSPVDNLYVGEPGQVGITIYNRGTKTLNDINYSLEYETSEGENVTLDSGVIDSLAKGTSITKALSAVFDEQGSYKIRARVNVSNDRVPGNDFTESVVEVLQHGADLSPFVYYPDNLFVGGENNIDVKLLNFGDLPSENGTLSLYYQEGECGCKECELCDNITLVETRDIDVDGFGHAEETFAFTPEQEGYVTLVAIANASNEVKESDNIDYVRAYVHDHFADPTLYFVYNDSLKLVGEPAEFDIKVYNYGDLTTNNVDVNLYLITNDGYELIGSQRISELAGQENQMLGFVYTPEEKGPLYLYANLSSDNDDVLDNNEAGYSELISSEGVDATLSSLYSMDRLVRGKSAVVRWGVLNSGTEEIDEANVTIFLNNAVVDSQIFSIAPSEEVYRSSQFIPPEAGNATIRAVVNVSGDIDESDNVLERTMMVSEPINVTFNIRDRNNNGTHRILLIDNWNNAYEVNGTLNVETVINPYSFGIFNLSSFESLEDSFQAQLVLEHNLSTEENIVSDYYPVILQNGSYYYNVFANRLPGYYNGTLLYAQLTENDTDALGIDTDNIEDYSVFLCEDFDFENNRCASWVESETADLYNYAQQSLTFVRLGAESDGKVEAFGIGYAPGFNGDSTDFNTSGDIVNNLILERSAYGKIVFHEPVNVTRFKANSSLLDNNIEIKHKKIGVDTGELYELEGKSAEIIFRNIILRNPRVIYNNTLCSSDRCSDLNYDAENNTLVMNVSQFSDYEIVEGPYCGDDVCQTDEGEACDTCVADCGSCAVSGHGGGGGTYHHVVTACLPNWTCYWGVCEDSVETYNCVDLEKCGVTSGRPEEFGSTRTCFVESNCTDNDGDGYGIGPDCLGVDVNDNDPEVTSIAPEGTFVVGTGNILLIVLIAILVLVLAVAGIFGMRYMKRKKLEQEEMMIKAREIVMKYRKAGYSDDKIKGIFRQNGWSEEDIEKLIM